MSWLIYDVRASPTDLSAATLKTKRNSISQKIEGLYGINPYQEMKCEFDQMSLIKS